PLPPDGGADRPQAPGRARLRRGARGRDRRARRRLLAAGPRVGAGERRVILVAWRMLAGDRAKYLSLVIGIAFAVLLITQQSSIFTGLMSRTFAAVTDVAAPVWVMDPGVRYPDDIRPMKDSDLSRVRDVEGVDWAVPLFKGTARARTAAGKFETCFVIGLDAATLMGGPARMLKGKITDLWEPDTVV